MPRTPPTEAPDPNRRRLLGRARNAGIAAAAATVLAPVPVTAVPQSMPPEPATDDQGRGYRESEHTRRYYALARF